MLKRVLALLAVIAALAGCTVAKPTVTGTVRDKYIEDFTEYTLVVEESNGTKHHFEVEEETWRQMQPGMPFSQSQQSESDD